MNSKNSCVVKELILKVRNNDQEAFLTLLNTYKPLIESSVNKFSAEDMFSTYREDLYQEASLVFYNSILAYDLDQNEVEFGLFAKICIRNALVSQLRVLKRRSEDLLEEIPESHLPATDNYDPAAKILEQEHLKTLYDIIRKNLSEFEYSVWQLYIAGRSSADIAKALSSDEKSINNAIYRVRKKLRTLLK